MAEMLVRNMLNV